MNNFTVSIYPIKSGEFLTSFTHPLTKKKVRERFASRQEAQNYQRTMEDKFKRPAVSSFQELTIVELLNLFNLDYPMNSFIHHSRSHLVDFVETFGDFKIDELNTDTLRVWMNQIQKENNLKSITMRGMKCDIDQFFKYLVEKEVISESPLTTIYYERSTPPLNSRNLLSEREISELLNSVKTYSPGYLYPLIKMFTETAAKTTEVIDLAWKDVDLEKKEVRFPQINSSRERVLKISDELVQILGKRKSKNGQVFLTYYGETFTKNKISRAIIEFKTKGNFKKDWSPMDLRHSFAVNFLTQGKSLRDLQYILGHDNVFQTKQLYGEAVKKVRFSSQLSGQESPISYQ